MAMLRICPLWKQKKRDGSGIFYAGRTQLPEMTIPADGSLFVFPVKSKQSDKSPDATLMMAFGDDKQQKPPQDEEGPDMFDGSDPETDDEFDDEGGDDLDDDEDI